MYKSLLLILTAYFFSSSLFSQVGINTDTPSAMLDVVGNVKIDESLFLENIAENQQIRGANLIIQTTDNRFLKYDTAISKYGPINYSKLIFEELSPDGLIDYDTKIDINDYSVTIQGYFFVINSNKSPEVLLRNDAERDIVEGYQIHAFKDLGTNTWHLQAIANNSRFYNPSLNGFPATTIDMEINLVIFRNGFITKPGPDVTIDMQNNTTNRVLPPTGF